MLGKKKKKKISIFKSFSYYLPRKQVLTFHVNSLLMKCQSLFSGENKKNVISLLSLELAQRVVKDNRRKEKINFYWPKLLLRLMQFLQTF